MRRLLRILGIILAIIILFFILATVAVNYFLSTAPLKARIEQAVYDKTHLTLKINGNIYWRLFPRFSLQVSDIDLSNPPGFPTDKPLLHTIELDLGLKILPLLQRRLIINHLLLDGLTLNLITDAHGKQNWGIPVSSSSTKNSTPTNAPSSNVAQQINIEAIELKNTNIYWLNQKTHQQIAVTQFNLTSNDISFNEPFNVQINGNLSTPMGHGQFNFSSSINLDLKNQAFNLENIKLTSQFTRKDQPIYPINLSLATKVEINLKQQHLSISNLNGSVNNLQLSGGIEGSQITSHPQFVGKFSLTNFNLRKLLTSLGIRLPQFTNPKALTDASGLIDFYASPTYIKLNNLRINLDNSTLTGNAAITNNQMKNIQFALALDQLDTNFYATTPTSTTETPNVAAKQNATQAAAAPLGFLAQVQSNGSINITNLMCGKTKLANINVNINSNQGTILLNPMQADIFDGNFKGSMHITTNNNHPAIKLNGALANIQIQSLLQSLDAVTKLKIQGTAGLNLDISTNGTQLPTLLQNLNGKFLFIVKDGVFDGMDLQYYFELGKALLQHQSLSKISNTHQTKFGSLSGAFNIAQGVCTTKNFLLQGPILEATGDGYADLVNQKINMSIVVNVTGNNHAIPLKVTGPFSSISIRPDLDKIIINQAKQQTQKFLTDQVNQIIGKNLGQDVANKINSLIK